MNRLRELRKAKRMTQTDVASLVGIGQSAYSFWESGRSKIDDASLRKLAAIFGVSVDYLLGGDDEDSAAEAFLRIPVVGSVPAGIPIDAIEDIVDWEEIPQAMTAGGKEYFGLRVKGDSMYPEYLDGDTVIVRRQPCCDNGDVCVVYVNGYEATLKQVKLLEDGGLSLIPRNPTYAPRTFTPEEIAALPVAICGVVVELRRKVKKL